MKKAVFYSIMALVMVLGLTLAMAVPVVAEVTVGAVKDTVPGTGHPKDVYLVYQYVSYSLTIVNQSADPMQVDWIRDRFALGTADPQDQYWNEEDNEWVAMDPGFSFSYPAGEDWENLDVTHKIMPEHLIDHPNIADAKGVSNRLFGRLKFGELPPTTHQATHTIRVIRPAIELEKTVTPTVAGVGQTVTYEFKITNIGDWPLVDITIEDDELLDDELQTQIPEDLVLARSGEVGDSHTFTYQYILKDGDLPLTNKAIVEGVAQHFSASQFPYADPEDELPTAVVRDTASATVSPELPPVGGSAHPVSRLALLAPWIVLAGLIAGAAVIVRSRKAQSRA